MSIGETLLRERADEVVAIAAKAVRNAFPDPGWYEYDDLIQDAVMYICQCACNYDPSQGSFSTFVYVSARMGAMHTIQRGKYNNRKTLRYAVSLDTPVRWSRERKEPIRLKDVVADPRRVDEEYLREAERRVLMDEIDALPDERMRMIICERYIDYSGKRKTYRQLGSELGICAERVRQLEEKAFRQLRARMEEKGYGLQAVQ